MVLYTLPESPSFSTTKQDFAQGPNPKYLLFFSSGTPPWCPHCVAAEPTVKQAFSEAGAPEGYLILTGDRPT